MYDPDCAITYWGMARANTYNEDRAKDLVEKAVELLGNASPREQLYITSLYEFLEKGG